MADYFVDSDKDVLDNKLGIANSEDLKVAG